MDRAARVERPPRPKSGHFVGIDSPLATAGFATLALPERVAVLGVTVEVLDEAFFTLLGAKNLKCEDDHVEPLGRTIDSLR